MKLPRALTFLIVIILILAACSLPASNKPVDNPNFIFTAAAQTVEVQLTQNALLNPTALPATPVPPTDVSPPTATTGPALPLPTSAASVTATLSGAGTPVPTKTCDSAQFVTDVTVPDGTNYKGGETFTKT